MAYPDHAPSCGVRLELAARNRGDGDVLELNGLLEQAVEKQAAMVRAPAEAEGGFSEVVVEVLGAEVLGADGALVGTEPALERGDPGDAA